MRLIRDLLSITIRQKKTSQADRCLGGVPARPKTVTSCRFQPRRAMKPTRFRPSILRRKVARAKLPLKGDRKRSLFRLHRDIRFSKDKSPYKTHAGAVLTRSGAKNDHGLFYIHVAPEECFAASGFYAPEPPDLARLRRAIVRGPRPYAKMVAALEKNGLELSREYDVSRVPREFAEAEDPAVIAALRKKSFICSRPIRAARLKSPALIEDLIAFAKDSLPLLLWGWAAIVDER
jgi:uncharacterized protein (TIGR02453 family)